MEIRYQCRAEFLAKEIERLFRLDEKAGEALTRISDGQDIEISITQSLVWADDGSEILAWREPWVTGRFDILTPKEGEARLILKEATPSVWKRLRVALAGVADYRWEGQGPREIESDVSRDGDGERYWREVVRQAEASGSVSKYLADRGIPRSTYYGNKTKHGL